MAVDDSYTKSLLHLDGADASTTITDESGKTWTAYDNAQIDTAQSVFGGASGLFDGTGDYIATPNNADFVTGASDFTVDFRIRWASVGNTGLFDLDNLSANRSYGCYFTSADTLLRFFYSTDGTNVTERSVTWSPSINTWYHVAVVRNGTNLFFFVDGTQVGTTQAISGTLFNSNAVFGVASVRAGAAYFLNGWIDEFRFSNGIARWTTNFTPPTSAYGISTTIKKVSGVAYASIKKVSGVAIANVKKISGVA